MLNVTQIHDRKQSTRRTVELIYRARWWRARLSVVFGPCRPLCALSMILCERRRGLIECGKPTVPFTFVVHRSILGQPPIARRHIPWHQRWLRNLRQVNTCTILITGAHQISLFDCRYISPDEDKYILGEAQQSVSGGRSSPSSLRSLLSPFLFFRPLPSRSFSMDVC